MTTPPKITSPDEKGFRKLIERRVTVLRYLLGTSNVLTDPIILLTFLSSFARSGMMFGINETARTADQGLGWPVAMLLFCAISMLVIGYISRIRMHALIIRVKESMRQRMTRNLLRANIDFLLTNPHGRVHVAMTEEVGQVSGAIINVIETIEAVVIVLIITPYIFWISWTAGVATFVAMALGTLGYMLFDRPARAAMYKASAAGAEFSNRVRDMLAGWKELRLRRSRSAALEAETMDVIRKVSTYANVSERLYAKSTAVGQSAVILLLCYVVIVVPILPGGGIDVMFQILTVIFLTSGPIEQLFGALPSMSRAENAYFRIQNVEADLYEAAAQVTQRDVAPRAGFSSIEMRDVSARISEPGRPASEAFEIGPINLSFKPGETVFVCGGNGSGKTTLMGLITGLRNPDKGDILVDGEIMSNDMRHGYRELFCGVFSDFHLFDRTFGMTAEEMERLDMRIKALNLSDRVTMQENKFSTLSLSAGQKRRLALAVALAEQRPIIILDEFAADQDPANRAFFYDVLVPELAAGGQLVIAITHDDHQFHKCDRLIKMAGGKIISDEKYLRPTAQEVG